MTGIHSMKHLLWQLVSSILGRSLILLVVAAVLAAGVANQASAEPQTQSDESATTSTALIELSNQAVLYGVVLDRITSSPIQGAYIQLSGDVDFTTMTLDGRFEFKVTAPGELIISGLADFYSTASARLSLQSPERVGPIMLSLQPMAGISGFTVDRQGVAISNVDVHVAYSEGWNFRAPRPTGAITTTDINGDFHVSEITPNRVFNLVFTHDTYARTTAGPFKLIPNQLESGVKVVMEPGSEIQGIVVDEDDYPIEGADVGVMQAEGQFRNAPAIARLAAAAVQGPDASVKTEPDGRFTLKNLPDSNFTVFARKDGYVYAYQDEVSPPKEGESEELKLVLRKGAVLSGVVMNSDEEPVPGARVTATRMNFRDPAREMRETDQDGHFKMENLLPGEYVVTVQAEGHPEFTVRDQEVPMEEVVYVLKDGGILRGVVKSSSTEDPITKFTVEVNLLGRGGRGGFAANFAWGGGGNDNRHSFEDSEGVFEIKNLAEGNYRVQVRSAGYAPSSRDRVGITEQQTTEIEIAMADGLSLSGIVMRHRDHAPVADARVELLEDAGGGGRGGQGGGRAIASGQSDAVGAFEFTELMPGTFRLRVRADGFTEYTEQIVLAPKSDDEVDVYLRSGGAVAGRVLDATSKQPIQGAQVTLSDGGNSNNWGRRGGNANANDSAITANDGTFIINPVDEGKINVRVTHRGFSSLDLTGKEVRTDETLDLGDLLLTGGGSIKGTVTNADGSAVSGAFMVANGPSGFRNEQTGADGSFEWTMLQAGEYTVSINRLPGDGGGRGNRGSMQQMQKTVTVEDGETAECHFQLQTGFRLSGIVTYHGEPADDWRISYSRLSGGDDDIETRNGTTQSNRQGEFSFDGLTDGRYLIVVHRRGSIAWGGGVSAVVERNVTIAGADEEIELVIPDSTVAGSVVDSESEQPISGARVTILRADTPVTADDILGGRLLQYRNTRTNSRGEFDLDNVTEGEWSVIAQHDDFSYAIQNITITPGENVEGLRFTLTTGYSLTVTAVSRSTGAPLKSVFIQIYEANGSLVREGNFAVDSLGKFAITGLKEGQVLLSGFAQFYAPVMGAGASVYPDSDNRATLEFEDGGTLKLIIQDAAGQPVKGAMARFIYSGLGIINYPVAFRNQVSYPVDTVTGANGQLTHEHLPSGYMTVEVTLPDGPIYRENAQISDGQTTELTIFAD